MNRSKAVDFFDVNCTIGRAATPPRHGPRTTEELLAAMDRAGIGRALVCHSLSLEAHPNVGNAAVIRETAGHTRLVPCWAALPPTTPEAPSPQDLLQAMGEAGVRAVRLCPSAGRHQFPLTSADASRLLAALAERRVPVLLDGAEATWEQVEATAKAHPRLPLILLGVGYRSIRALYPILEAVENVLVEISLYQVCGGLREGVGRFGPRRFLFGTSLPRFEPGCAVASVVYADVSDDAKALIAGGNLDALLREAQP
ncbi:MAG TPA: amidohydrolase family protein [Planctomycetota bacterium]|nr:amidohydrolase family protein [Planctomycetota bacterium]